MTVGRKAMEDYLVSDASWQIHWDEVAVFDFNSAALGKPPFELMIAAGKHLANMVASGIEQSMKTESEVWILCGPGNNGGDGYVAAKVLSDEGYKVRILSSHQKQKTELSQAARDHSLESEDLPVHVWVNNGWDIEPPEINLTNVVMIVDALLGVGSGGAGEANTPRGVVKDVLLWTANHFSSGAPRVLACDVPTGFGSELQLRAGRTLTFHEEKLGMRNCDGQFMDGLGDVIVAPLPFPAGFTDVGIGDAIRYPRLTQAAIKGDRGRVLIVGGGPYHGAPILAGLGAARMGCDLVHIAMPSISQSKVEWPPDLIPEKIPDDEYLTEESVKILANRMTSGRRVQAMVIGPGLGRNEETIFAVRSLLEVAIQNSIPCVVDADAIYALPRGKWPENLIGVATPHESEKKFWLGNISPSEAISEATEGVWNVYSDDVENAVIITTGAIDHLVGIGGRECNASGGNPRMAMGGTGDLLAGAIGGLLATGMSPWAASRLACYILRESGNVADSQLGPGLVSSDLPQYMAGALATALLIQG